LHSGNIFSYDLYKSVIGDLGLCQQAINKKNDPNKIFGVIPYLAPEVLLKKPYTKESDIYSFGIIMWEFITGKKPFHDRQHNHILISDILKGERLQITYDTPEFYAKLMRRCWDHNPKNRQTAREIRDHLHEYNRYNITEEKKGIIKLAEAKRQGTINSEEYLLDTKNYKHHPDSCYTSRLLNESIQQVESLLNLSSTKIWINNKDNNGDKDGLSDTKNHKDHSEQFYASCSPGRLTQQVESLILSSTEMGSKTHHIEEDGDGDGPVRKKSKIFHK